MLVKDATSFEDRKEYRTRDDQRNVTFVRFGQGMTLLTFAT